MAMVLMVGLMFQASSLVPSVFIGLHHNVRKPKERSGPNKDKYGTRRSQLIAETKLATLVDEQQEEDVKGLPWCTSTHYKAGEQQQEEGQSFPKNPGKFHQEPRQFPQQL